MAAFQYRALDARGREQKGVIEAESARAARVALRERQLAPLDVGALGGAGTGKARRAHLGVADLTLLSRQWATLLAAGLTVEHTLAALIEQSEREPVRRLLAGVRSEIVAGYSLSAALERFPNAFPTLYRASVAAGEHSGELPRVMLQLADHLEQGDALRRKTLQALIYPALVACVALAIVTALMVWVVPQVVGVFSQSRQSLPALTELMIALSAFIRNWGGAVLLVIGGLGLSFARALRQHTFRLGVDRLLLRLPLLGRHLRTLDATRFASTLAILVGSGVPLLAALEAGARVVQRLPLRNAVREASEKVREGVSLSRALAASRCFPPLLLHMIANGEATGQIAPLLDKAAHLQCQELELRTATLTSLIEPALLLTMGAFVLLIVLAVMQPIIEINTLMR
jgi:general secretion pathway protein F